MTTTRTPLRDAIRAFTVDRKDVAGKPIPNGPAEAAHDRLCRAIQALPSTPETLEIFRLGEAYCQAESERIRALRRAAEDFFGEDFRSCQP